jgi:hypothetical protein
MAYWHHNLHWQTYLHFARNFAAETVGYTLTLVADVAIKGQAAQQGAVADAALRRGCRADFEG